MEVRRADRTNVGGVEGVVVIEADVRVDGDRSVSAALGESEDGFFGDFVHEADTAAAHNAAFVVEADVFANIDVLGLLDLGFLEAGLAAAVFDGKFLKFAFAGLVADRAVERVINKEELHHALAVVFDQLAGGADSHVLGDGVGASNDGDGASSRFPDNRRHYRLDLRRERGGEACPSAQGTCGSCRERKVWDGSSNGGLPCLPIWRLRSSGCHGAPGSILHRSAR